ncbi:hypothetical protein MJ257_22785 [Paenibacillus timonensis]|uniref:Uncharacterized protein n=1 Tax=Paenibacillus timonensis TaxID=225915 RepID=A0ABW3SL78_9BACL|nr:hypothetical protein [Paenibacillus timonensis]MCH1642929.1 hypothetical protein [Paenibacillus timonensis]
MQSSSSPEWLIVLKDSINVLFFLINISFFCIVGTVTILTYKTAKKTLLQPIRTEIFKEQLKEFSSLLEFFNGKDETDYRKQFAFDKLLSCNAISLMDKYARLFFDVEIDPDKRPYNITECPSSIFTSKGAEKYLAVCDEHVITDNGDIEKPIKPDPRTRAAIWSSYEQHEIHIPREFSETEDRLKKIKNSPLLPVECVDLIDRYIEVAYKNVDMIRELLTNCARELPEKYADYELMKKASISWIHHKYVDEFEHLSEPASNIIKYIRHYFSVDNLKNPK